MRVCLSQPFLYSLPRFFHLRHSLSFFPRARQKHGRSVRVCMLSAVCSTSPGQKRTEQINHCVHRLDTWGRISDLFTCKGDGNVPTVEALRYSPASVASSFSSTFETLTFFYSKLWLFFIQNFDFLSFTTLTFFHSQLCLLVTTLSLRLSELRFSSHGNIVLIRSIIFLVFILVFSWWMSNFRVRLEYSSGPDFMPDSVPKRKTAYNWFGIKKNYADSA